MADKPKDTDDMVDNNSIDSSDQLEDKADEEETTGESTYESASQVLPADL